MSTKSSISDRVSGFSTNIVVYEFMHMVSLLKNGRRFGVLYMGTVYAAVYYTRGSLLSMYLRTYIRGYHSSPFIWLALFTWKWGTSQLTVLLLCTRIAVLNGHKEKEEEEREIFCSLTAWMGTRVKTTLVPCMLDVHAPTYVRTIVHISISVRHQSASMQEAI